MSNLKELLVLVEDEEILGEALVFNLESEGYEVKWFQEGQAALNFITTKHANIAAIVLDLMLPGVDGFEILKRTRVLAEQIPIAILSAKSLESDKIAAFEYGADDYVTKPFSLPELLMRLRVLIKKTAWYRNKPTPENLLAGHSSFALDRLVVEQPNGQSTRLSPTEGLLLKTFLDNPNKIFTRAELLEKVWNHQKTLQTRTVDVFVSKLRKLIEPNPTAPMYLLSQRSIGYTYVTDEKLRKELERSPKDS
jgi:two-component system alkaline phosphatase synthesis response regulator PhoP